MRPWLAPYQLNALFGPERYAVIEATTKAGKTVGALVWLTEQAMAGATGRNYWWVAPVSGQAKIAYRRLKGMLPRRVYSPVGAAETRVTLVNGASIWFKSADKPDSLYGEDVYAAVVDEASRCKEDAWYALRSTLTATQGPVRIIGNVKGRKNWAYREARKAEAGEPGMSYAKITAYDATKAIKPNGKPIIAPEEVEDARRRLPDAVFREMFLAEPSDDTGNPFGGAAINACISPDLSVDDPVAFGLDLAKSIDWSVLIGLDSGGRACRYDRWQGPWEATIARVVTSAAMVPTLVDSTGAGDPVLESLQKDGRDGGARFEGYVFSSASKQRLMEGLAVAIQRRAIRYPDGPIVQELLSFEYEYTRTGVRYSAPEGYNDDCVCSLALAVQMLTQVEGLTFDVQPDVPTRPEGEKLAYGSPATMNLDAEVDDVAEDEDAEPLNDDMTFRQKGRHRYGYGHN